MPVRCVPTNWCVHRYSSAHLPLLIGVCSATPSAWPVLCCVSPPIPHAIPPLVFRDVNRNRWDFKVCGGLVKWVIGELHAECGEGFLGGVVHLAGGQDLARVVVDPVAQGQDGVGERVSQAG